MILTLAACVVISCINLFYINEVNRKTKTAFLSTIITTVILVLFITVITNKAMIQGFGEEEIEELGMFSFYIGIDFVKIAVSVIIMSTIGAITDAAIAISSPMREMQYHHPQIEPKRIIPLWNKYWKRYIRNKYKYTVFCLLWGLFGITYMV